MAKAKYPKGSESKKLIDEFLQGKIRCKFQTSEWGFDSSISQ